MRFHAIKTLFTHFKNTRIQMVVHCKLIGTSQQRILGITNNWCVKTRYMHYIRRMRGNRTQNFMNAKRISIHYYTAALIDYLRRAGRRRASRCTGSSRLRLQTFFLAQGRCNQDILDGTSGTLATFTLRDEWVDIYGGGSA